MELKIGKANVEVFASVLLKEAKKDKDILVVTSDSRGSGKLGTFAEQLPDQLIEVGIAEQNLVGIAAGLASCGKKVFAVSPASFLTTRALEQIKNDVCYSDNPVKLIGISAGVSYGALGSTHHSLHDLAVLRAINNINIIVPADNFETRETCKASINFPRPLYIRFGKYMVPHLNDSSDFFRIGVARPILQGQDVAFFATGETVHLALQAAHALAADNIYANVTSIHTIKPLDSETILTVVDSCKVVITVEEHMTNGGLGEAVASILMQNRVYKPFKIFAIPDEYSVTGSQIEIFRHYGLSAQSLVTAAKNLYRSLHDV